MADKIETLGGHSYEAVMRTGNAEPWDLTYPSNLYSTLLRAERLKVSVLDASWVNDHLEARDDIDLLAATVDIDALAKRIAVADVETWVALVFGQGALPQDSYPIYAAPPRDWDGSALELVQRRTSYAELFVSQTLLYMWHAARNDLPLMVSAVRRHLVTAGFARNATRSGWVIALEALTAAERRYLEQLSEIFPMVFPACALPAPLGFVLAQAESPADIFRVALEGRSDGRFRGFRAWAAAIQDALDRADLKRLCELRPRSVCSVRTASTDRGVTACLRMEKPRKRGAFRPPRLSGYGV